MGSSINDGTFMWKDENGNWHPVGHIANIEPATNSPDNEYTSILHMDNIQGPDCSIIVTGQMTDEGAAVLWATVEGPLEIVKRGNTD